MPEVYLLWDADYLVDIYASIDDAEKAAEERKAGIEPRFRHQVTIQARKVK
jgi:hypothetical protein